MKKNCKIIFLILNVCILFLLTSCVDLENILINLTNKNSSDQIITTPHTHIEVIDEKIQSTCTTPGLTQGSHCSKCGEILVSQEIIPAIKHDYVISWDYNAENNDALLICQNDNKHIENIVVDVESKLIKQVTPIENGLRTYTATAYVDEKEYIDIKNVEIEYIQSEGLEFKLNEDNKSYSVIGIGTFKGNDLIIPSMYNELPVTNIGFEAFTKCDNLKNVIIPDSVITIENGAFLQCKDLSDLIIGNNVTTIGKWAFSGCGLKSVTIPKKINIIDTGAFDMCSELVSVYIPSSVNIVGSYVFNQCYKLTIYCETSSQPSEWNSNFDSDVYEVIWGYTM